MSNHVHCCEEVDYDSVVAEVEQSYLATHPFLVDLSAFEAEEQLAAAIYEISQRHDWEHTTDREDRTAEILAAWRNLRDAR